jgi:hypothetical protein
MLMKKMRWVAGPVVLLMAGLAQAALFTGNGVDQNFSTTANWDAAPVTGDNIAISHSGTSVSSPAVIDSGFSVNLGSAKIYSEGAGGTGMAYAEVVSGGTLKASLIYVGNSANQYYDGTLTLRTGSATVARYLDSGNLTIGGGDIGELGFATVEAGVSFSHARLSLQTYGTLTYELGASSVSTFSATDTTDGSGDSLLDGLLQVDFAALTSTGSYTLLDTRLTIGGALIDDLTRGSISDISDSTHFNVLNAADGAAWNLTTANDGQDLVLNVMSIPEPTTLGMLGFAAVGILAARRMRI